MLRTRSSRPNLGRRKLLRIYAGSRMQRELVLWMIQGGWAREIRTGVVDWLYKISKGMQPIYAPPASCVPPSSTKNIATNTNRKFVHIGSDL